jgi:adenylate kinase
VRVALTGTPGTGKSAVAAALSRRGVRVLSLNDEAARAGLLSVKDRRRGSFEVDVNALDRAVSRRARSLPHAEPLVFEGHLAHFLSVDAALVLRCPPPLLARRLRRRGWAERKVRENVCAEAVGVIATEAVQRLGVRRVFEFCTGGARAQGGAGALLRVASGKATALRAGRIDYLEEAPTWC